MTFWIRAVAKALVFFVVSAAVSALWRFASGGAVGSLGDLAQSALAITLGSQVGDLLLSRFRSRGQRRVRRRPVVLWAVAMGVCGAAAFAASGFANGSDWTMSQWGLAFIVGGGIGSAVGAFSASLQNAQRVRVAQPAR